ncbi:MAG TPA: A24 family peptidase [Clostridia bacterium]|nr:A24 family peptidase [Clostridia bacterium]
MSHSAGILSNITAVAVVAAAAFIDIRTRRIPDRLVLAATAAGLFFLFAGQGRGWPDGLLGGFTAGLVMLLVHRITGDGLGLGDVKLFGCTGIYLGLEGVLSAMVTAVVLSGVYSVILVCISRDNKKREIPFAPFILAGTLGAIFL